MSKIENDDVIGMPSGLMVGWEWAECAAHMDAGKMELPEPDLDPGEELVFPFCDPDDMN